MPERPLLNIPQSTVPLSGGSTTPTDRLERWARDARADAERISRLERKQAEWRQSQDSTMRGALSDLGESGSRISLRLTNGSTQVGHLARLGSDFCRIDGGLGMTLVALDSIATVRAEPGARTVRGDVRSDGKQALADVVTSLAEDRTEVVVSLRCGGSERYLGRVAARGTDLVVVDTIPGGRVYIAATEIATIRLSEMAR